MAADEGKRNVKGDLEEVFQLNMSAFIPPHRRSDGFYSMRYKEPPVYQADSLMIKCPVGCDVTMFVEGHAVYVKEGDLLLVAPFARHHLYQIEAEGTLANVVLRPTAIAEVLPRIFLTTGPLRSFLEQCRESAGPVYLHLPTGELSYVKEAFRELVDFYRREEHFREEEVLLRELKLEEVFLRVYLEDIPAALSGSGEDELSQILGYVQSSLRDVTLKEAAKHLGWHPSALSRFLKKRTGRSFSELVQALRLDEASTLLLRTRMTVEEVMAQVGYTGKANFYSLFQTRFGMTPSQYRRDMGEMGKG